MLRSFAKLPSTQRSQAYSLAAPVGGWNARDALANMDEMDAVIMENMFPTASDVMVRNGFSVHATVPAGEVESLLTWAGSTANKMFAAVGSAFIEVTAAATATATAVGGLANARWQYTNFTNAAGTIYLYACNGVNGPYLYDGTNWTSATATGVTANNFINVNVFKSRLWLIENNTLKAWYLNAGAITGTATAVDLSGFTKLGGQLMSMGTWTLDAGDGVDDYAVFVTSKGEVLVFQGTDPTSSSTWAMRGRWEIGAPIGRRCLQRFGGDLLLVCIDGVLPLSRALISSRVNPKVALTDKIQQAMSSAATLYNANFGWEILHWPEGDQVILNVPVETNGNQQQFVMNTITGAWCNFDGIDANCWVLWNEDPYFGGQNMVGKYGTALNDNGAVINWEVHQAFSYFGSRGVLKQFYEARPIFQSNGTPSIFIGLNTDYSTDSVGGTLNFSAPSYGIWDTATWDSGVWGGSLSVIANWQGITGSGVCAGLDMIGQTSGIETHWAATDFIYERGGIGTM